MPYPRVIPHRDGGGKIDAVADGVDFSRVGERVCCFGGQRTDPSARQRSTWSSPTIRP